MTTKNFYHPLLQRLMDTPGWSPDYMPRQPYVFGPVRDGYRPMHTVTDIGDSQRVFVYDYMGAAEYEFGAIPEALWQLSASPAIFQMTVPNDSFPKEDLFSRWSLENYFVGNHHVRIFGLVRQASDIPEAQDLLLRMAAGTVRSKGGHWMERLLLVPRAKPRDRYGSLSKLVGWLDCNHHWAGFAQRERASQFQALLTGTYPTEAQWAAAAAADLNGHLVDPPQLPEPPPPEDVVIRVKFKKPAEKKKTKKKGTKR